MADFCKYEESAKQDFPKCVRNRLEELDPDVLDNLLLITGMESAMIGVMENAAGNTVGVYERNLCIQVLANSLMRSNPGKTEEQAYAEAAECISYTTERALPYGKDKAPVIIQGFACDGPAWNEFEIEDNPDDD